MNTFTFGTLRIFRYFYFSKSLSAGLLLVTKYLWYCYFGKRSEYLQCSASENSPQTLQVKQVSWNKWPIARQAVPSPYTALLHPAQLPEHRPHTQWGGNTQNCTADCPDWQHTHTHAEESSVFSLQRAGLDDRVRKTNIQVIASLPK